MTISLDPIEMRTGERLAGVKSLLCLLKDINGEYLERKRAEFQRYARERGY